KGLAPLRDEGVLVIGSGNVVHNLPMRVRGDAAPALPWAIDFDNFTREHVLNGEYGPLVDYEDAPGAALSIPTNEHYLPLLYCLALCGDGEPVSVVTDGIVMGSISMLSFGFGVVAQ